MNERREFAMAMMRVRKAEDTLEDCRAQLGETIRRALDAGVTQAQIAQVLGISRQRVSQLVKRLNAD